MAISVDEIKRYLLKHHIKPSYSRLKIFEYLAATQTHPTVDEIYNALVEEMPTLSKTTVYNTLSIFIQENITRVINIEDNELRYDADITNHGHFKCEQCNAIYDFDIDLNFLKTGGLDNFNIKQKSVCYKGICFSCLDNDKI